MCCSGLSLEACVFLSAQVSSLGPFAANLYMIIVIIIILIARMLITTVRD